MKEYYIGLMSGTSMDAIDAALVDLTQKTPKILATYREPIPPKLKKALKALCFPGDDEINRMGQMDAQMGQLFAKTVNALLQTSQYPHTQVRAIGHHGQTIRHHPNAPHPFTLQIGDPNIIALQTNITVVADFRRRDIAAGGQGAPLAPAFHNHVFRDPKKNRCVVNIGGIANITILSADTSRPIIGFDTGPGNTLLDAWAEKHIDQPCDQKGHWGRSGQIQTDLLNTLLQDPYFQMKAPKSTGQEYFNLAWLGSKLTEQHTPVDIQATLTQLTALTILDAIKTTKCGPSELFICGGGAYNEFLMSQLANNDQGIQVYSSEALNLAPEWVEAVAFAWLAQRTLETQTGNIPTVTGAKKAVTLGGIYVASEPLP